MGALEFPVGHLEAGDSPLDAAKREFHEETGIPLPDDAEMVGSWLSEDRKCQVFCYRIPHEADIELGTPEPGEIGGSAWWDIDDLDDKEVRDKVRENLDRSEPILERAEKSEAVIDYSGRIILPVPLRVGDRVVIEHRGEHSETLGLEDIDDLKGADAGLEKATADHTDGGSPQEQAVAEAHAPKVQAALASQVNPSVIAQRFAATAGAAATGVTAAVAGMGATALGAAASIFAATLSIPTAALAVAILSIWADAWILGAKEARDSLDEKDIWVPSEDPLDQRIDKVNWGEWAPGNPPSPKDLPGFEDIESQLATLVKGITETTRREIAAAVQRFADDRVVGPWRPEELQSLADEIEQIVGNPDRAMLIARTETNRSMNASAIQLLHRAGVTMFDLVPHPTACPLCKAVAAANPHPLSDKSAIPPLHPNGRCSIAPAVMP